MTLSEHFGGDTADLPGMLGQGREGGFESLMGTFERSKIEAPELSAAALPEGPVITGEGPDDRRSCAFHLRACQSCAPS
jgi:hypothetical protein